MNNLNTDTEEYQMITELDSVLNCNNRVNNNYFYTGLSMEELTELYELLTISLQTLISSNVFGKLRRITRSRNITLIEEANRSVSNN
jgi:hypothetical protein